MFEEEGVKYIVDVIIWFNLIEIICYFIFKMNFVVYLFYLFLLMLIDFF